MDSPFSCFFLISNHFGRNISVFELCLEKHPFLKLKVYSTGKTCQDLPLFPQHKFRSEPTREEKKNQPEVLLPENYYYTALLMSVK